LKFTYPRRNITFLKEPHKGKINSANNKTENYIENIIPKADKNKFQRILGFINRVYHLSNNWIKNKKFQLTNGQSSLFLIKYLYN
jgi:serine protease inhibitor